MNESASKPTTTDRDAKGHFLPGNAGGPGGVAGRKCGRGKALAILDEMLEEAENLETLKEALAESFKKNPVRFFRQIIMPLLPKDTRVEIAQAGPIVWTRLKDAFDAEADSQLVP